MTLYAHQKAILADDPVKTGLWLGTGSGKTRTALLLARGKTLVICPKTQYEDKNWQREAISLGINIPIEVISKEKFRSTWKEIPRYDTVIVDEAHTCLGVTPGTRTKNGEVIPRTSQLFEALDAYMRRTKPERLYLCTATIMKSPMTVWGAAKILGKLNNESFLRFRAKFYTRLPMPGRDVYAPRSDNASKEALAKFVKKLGYVGRLEDFFDVPEQTFKKHYIELTEPQKKRLKDISLEYPDPIVQIGKKHQIENGVLSSGSFLEDEVFPSNKIDALLDYAIEFPRMVVFAKYTAQIRQIQEALTKAGKKVLTMTGETKDRGALIKEANESKECVFLCQAQISAGWELPEYPVMIFASRTYSFVDYDQALGRIQRANNIKKNLYITLVVRGGIDEAVDKSLANKCDFNEKLYANK